MKRCLLQAQFLAVAVMLAGCGSDDSTNGGGSGGSGGNVLIKSSTSPADAQCAGGGTKLEFGKDKNGNATLDADEVTSTQTICSVAPTLTTVTESGVSAKCKNGGTTVKSGVDTNGNGKLDDNEVKDTQEICDGGSSNMLATTTTLPSGDINCAFGGVKTESGLDNGAGGATAGDGVLAPSEITSTKYSCTKGTSPFAKPLDPPSGPAGTNKIYTSGGAGNVGAGGSGQLLQLGVGVPVFGGQGTGGGNTKIWKTGTVDASFTMAAQTPVFGATKMEVAANKTIATYANNASGQVDGEYYTINNNGLFFRQNAGNPQVTVTGVHVAAGVTLTFPMNGINFAITDDFHNEGTVTSALNGVNRGSVQMTVAKYISTTASKVTLTGGNGTGAAGGTGGAFAVLADAIYNAGDIDASGGNGDAAGSFNGGSAQTVQLAAQRTGQSGPAQNTGNIKAAGGTGKAVGGSGSVIFLIAATKGVYSKGTLDSSGGGGGTGGGMANVIQVMAGLGSVYLSGALNAKGGDVDEAVCPATCTGGNGSTILVQTSGGEIVSSAPLTSVGGKSKGNIGGSGGTNILRSLDGTDPLFGGPRPAGSIRMTGTVDGRGGAGGNGGPGGPCVISVVTTQPFGQELEMFGYDTIDASGGNGVTGGGFSGPVTIWNQASPGSQPSGSTVVHANVLAKGGAASTSGNGGSGSGIQIWASNGNVNYGLPTKTQTVLIGGSLDASGGNGVGAGGSGGPIDLRGREQVDIFGTVTSSGGNTSGNGVTGGGVSNLTINSGGAVNVNAAIAFKGGNATGTAAQGGSTSTMQIFGGTVKATAPISLAGGNGNGATGGSGNTIDLRGSQAPSSIMAVTSLGGTGTPNGTNGAVFIDGNQQP